ncbi:hypothetical protein CAPTEDRAFT_218804 [Capitella teleta]|uniref:Uncharacterized protein n=1 Tax=Capitella teleta TaxID=283909 RepID=R7U5Z7_CAPTE|nr:hypothetical protein CAPTEDRAFT_218804 [Capitella teleta]|eukprot:ELU01790.1 hypothetical protein CAPTEDRAFT_218804 [Capitella teleta]
MTAVLRCLEVTLLLPLIAAQHLHGVGQAPSPECQTRYDALLVNTRRTVALLQDVHAQFDAAQERLKKYMSQCPLQRGFKFVRLGKRDTCLFISWRRGRGRSWGLRGCQAQDPDSTLLVLRPGEQDDFFNYANRFKKRKY